MNPVAAVEASSAAWAGNPVTTVLMLSLLSLAPFLLMMTTSFVKFSVVFSILRSALGTQQIPPTPVILGLAVVLSAYVMGPTASQVMAALRTSLEKPVTADVVSPAGSRMIFDAIERGREPLRDFLKRHAHPQERELFHHFAVQMKAQGEEKKTEADDLIVLVPAFAVSELSEAFMFGFLIFLPFLVIDMVVSNTLLALGMHMLSPTTVSMPFKILLFVMIDGWDLLIRGLLQGYV